MLDMPYEHELAFHKSSYSSGRQENCVEVAETPSGAAMRDTQNRSLGHLTFPKQEWSALLIATRR